jgi:tetratricopeptide (TPR) repeat protein
LNGVTRGDEAYCRFWPRGDDVTAYRQRAADNSELRMRLVAFLLIGLVVSAAGAAHAADDARAVCQQDNQKGSGAKPDGCKASIAESDAAACSKYSQVTADERAAACDRILAASGASGHALSVAHLWKGSEFNKARQWNAEFNEYEIAVKSDPGFWEAYDRRGLLKNWYKHDIDGALSDFDESIRRGPTDVEAYVHRGEARIVKGDYDGAIADFNLALPHVKPGSRALFERGRAKLAKKDYDGAIVDLSQEINTKPPWIYLVLARRCRAYTEKGQIDAAIADCNESIRLGSQTPSSYAARGQAYIAQGNFDKAIADFNVAIERNANTVQFYAGRGQAFELKKDFDNARADYQIAATKPHPGDSAEDSALRQFALQRLQALSQLHRDGSLPLQRRVALTIGNGAYTNVPALPNPPKDANAVAKALEDVGFKVTQLADDLPRAGFLQALRTFSIEAAKSEWAVIYYGGHGMEVGGVNYLIPVDAKLAADRDAQSEAVSLELVIASVSGANKMRLVLLDACRDNPFAKNMQRTIGLQLVNKGLSNIEPDAGIMIVYATKHGETALDGEGGHSPFATAGINDIPKPGIEVRRLFDVVRDDVIKATNREQQPFSYGSLPGSQEFYFVSPK